jgi:hypothetical protein
LRGLGTRCTPGMNKELALKPDCLQKDALPRGDIQCSE